MCVCVWVFFFIYLHDAVSTLRLFQYLIVEKMIYYSLDLLVVKVKTKKKIILCLFRLRSQITDHFKRYLYIFFFEEAGKWVCVCILKYP